MEEIHGFTAIDTLFELMGFHLAWRFQETLFAVLVPLAVVVGIVRTLHTAQEDRRYRGVVFYVMYAFLMIWAIWPVKVGVALPAGLAPEDLDDLALNFERMNQGETDRRISVSVKAPRIMAWLYLGIDRLSEHLSNEVNQGFHETPFGSSRVTALLRAAKIQDENLRERYHAFVVSCYLPVLAVRRQRGLSEPIRYYDPFALGPKGETNYAEYAIHYPHNLSGEPIDAGGRAIELSDDQRLWNDRNVRTIDTTGNRVPLRPDGRPAFDAEGNIIDPTTRAVVVRKEPGKPMQLFVTRSDRAMCLDVAGILHRDLAAHVQENSTQKQLGSALAEVLAARGARAKHANNWELRVSEFVLAYVLYNETMALLGLSEIQNLQRTMTYKLFDSKQQSITPVSGDTSPDGTDLLIAGGLTLLGPLGYTAAEGYLAYKSLGYVSSILKLKQSVDSAIQNQAEPAANWYRITTYAPWVYGITTMILISIFPFAGFVSLLPGKWTAIILWAEVVLSVKLWLVFWSILSAFNEWRGPENLGPDPSKTFGDPTAAWPAVVLLYGATPLLSGVVVALLAAAAKSARGFGGDVSSGGGAASINVWNAAGSAAGQVGRMGGTESAGAGAAGAGSEASAAEAGEAAALL